MIKDFERVNLKNISARLYPIRILKETKWNKMELSRRHFGDYYTKKY